MNITLSVWQEYTHRGGALHEVVWDNAQLTEAVHNGALTVYTGTADQLLKQAAAYLAQSTRHARKVGEAIIEGVETATGMLAVGTVDLDHGAQAIVTVRRSGACEYHAHLTSPDGEHNPWADGRPIPCPPEDTQHEMIASIKGWLEWRGIEVDAVTS